MHFRRPLNLGASVVLALALTAASTVLVMSSLYELRTGLVVPTLAGLIGLFLAIIYLYTSVVGPIARLARSVRRPSDERDDGPVPTRVPGEIASLALAFGNLAADVAHWRQRTIDLAYNLKGRINGQAAQIARELHQSRREAWTDPLTGLGNRRMLDEKLPVMFETQRRNGRDLSVVMLDMDHFKTLNDARGHAAGDELLEFTGQLLRQCVRYEDLAVRLGGDEFLLVLVGVTADQARAIADRTVRLFAQQARLLDVAPRPTMSAGIASLADHDAAHPAALLRMADRALYEAKRAGKSRAVVHGARPARIRVGGPAEGNVGL